jgi:dTDP-4-dehydrorhamnose 3,5-epimerase
MTFTRLGLEGACVIGLERHDDERGFFARSWCRQEFAAHGLNAQLAQCNISFNMRRGTLRGLHYQAKPYEEAKVVRCTRGAAYDVILDLRADSATYLRWEAVELTEDNHLMVYVPEGFAHGFQTLVDGTEIFYQMSEAYRADYARGIRWDDPTFGIHWPDAERIISARDRAYPDFVPERSLRAV